MIKYIKYIIIILSLSSYAQHEPFEIDHYSFVNYDINHLNIYNDKNLDAFFDKADNLVLRGVGKLNVLQIGDSHIQGGYLPDQIRYRMQHFAKDLNGGRGFLFPYRLAKTNNPVNYLVRYTGSWSGCRNVEKKKNCLLGLSGISATTYAQRASVNITMNQKRGDNWHFNKVRVFHNSETAYEIQTNDPDININGKFKRFEHYTEIEFNKSLSEITLEFIKSDKGDDNKFVLYGLSFDNDDPGVVFHSVGVNGAEVSSYLRCKLFSEHLAVLNPNLVIISLGTNDAYVKVFDTLEFKRNYDTLLSMIKRASPDAAIILTTPGDNYRRRRYVNRNNPLAAKIILELAEEKNLSVWNFYEVMGSMRSIASWYRKGLTARDRLHFSKRGYEFQADLFFNALLKAYDKHVEDKFFERNKKMRRY